MKKNILIITGEPSGDLHAGELLKELRTTLPDSSFWGIGGDCMKKHGMELIEHVRNLSMVGVWEVIKSLPKIRAQFKLVKKNIQERKPDLAILVDYPGFNLRLAEYLNKQGIPVIYYIIPQVWAWGRGRVKKIKRYVNKALVLFKFEEDFLRQYGIDAEFVGHPLVDRVPAKSTPEKQEDALTIALLPGSRKSEVEALLPVMLNAADRIKQRRNKTQFILAESSNIEDSLYDSALSGHLGINVNRLKDSTFEALDKSDFAIVTSGTATLETAMMGTPMVITYRAAALTAFIFFNFVRIPFLGLVNIIAGKEVVPELLQKNATPERLEEKVIEIVNDDARLKTMKDELGKVRDSLGGKGASRKAAEAISTFIKTSAPQA